MIHAGGVIISSSSCCFCCLFTLLPICCIRITAWRGGVRRALRLFSQSTLCLFCLSQGLSLQYVEFKVPRNCSTGALTSSLLSDEFLSTLFAALPCLFRFVKAPATVFCRGRNLQGAQLEIKTEHLCRRRWGQCVSLYGNEAEKGPEEFSSIKC